jgi:hypothetical protein
MLTKLVPAIGVIALAAASATTAQSPGVATGEASGITVLRSTTSGATTTITDLQRTRLAEKLALVDRIMTTVAAQADGTTSDQRQWLRERLYGTSVAQLQAMGTPSTFQAASAALTPTAATTKDLGDPTDDLVYRPIAPCRYIDTRNVGGPIVGMRDFNLATNGSTYGGAGACDPETATPAQFAGQIAAININVTIVGPGTAPGFIGVRPIGSANTTSLVNWYVGGPTVQAANAAAVSTGDGGIEFFGSPVNVVVDVLGIFTTPANPPPKIIQTFSYLATPGGAGLDTLIPTDRPVQILATVETPGMRGVSEVTIRQCCAGSPQFLEWVGLNSPGDASITSGFSSALGAPILKMDFDGTMLLEVSDATHVRVHNTSSTVTHTGTLSIVEY